MINAALIKLYYMKASIKVIVCMLLLGQINAQDNSFIKIFDNGQWGYEFIGSLYQKDNKIHLISTSRVDNEFGGIIRIRTFNPDNSSSDIIFQGSNNDRGHSIRAGVQINNQSIVVGLHDWNAGGGTNDYDFEITSLSSAGVKFQFSLGGIDTFESGYGMDIDMNGDIVACGLISKYQGSVDNESIVLKIDTLGNEIWTKRIRARYNELKARAVTTDDEGNIYVLADEESIFPSIQQVALVKLSSTGDSLWTKYYPASASLAKDIQFNKNGNLIASVTGDYDGNGRSFTMMELDTSGTILGSKSYINELGTSQFAERFIQLKDGGYAVCLDIGYPVLLVLDEDASLTNVQHYDGYGVRAVRDLIELEDGSFAIAGNITEFNQEIPKVMWLIKTNTEGELVTSTIEETYPEFKIFPNPTNDIINISGIDFNFGIVINSLGQIIARIKSDATIDFSNYSSGIYYLMLSTENGHFTKQIVKE